MIFYDKHGKQLIEGNKIKAVETDYPSIDVILDTEKEYTVEYINPIDDRGFNISYNGKVVEGRRARDGKKMPVCFSPENFEKVTLTHKEGAPVKREDFILEIPNVSFVNDDEEESQNIEDLLAVADQDYVFACGDIFTKTCENDSCVEWGCKNSFMIIRVEKDGSEYYYGEANMLPNSISYYE